MTHGQDDVRKALVSETFKLLFRHGLALDFIIGFGISLATEEIRVPLPPAIIIVFILAFPHSVFLISLFHKNIALKQTKSSLL